MSFQLDTDNLTMLSNSSSTDNFTLMKNSSGINGPPEYSYYFYSFNAKEFFSAFRFRLDTFLWKYMSLVVTIVSFFGNMTVVLVLLRKKKNRLSSTSIFIMNLAIADIFVCLAALEGFLMINKYVKETYSDLDCKLRPFLPKVTQYVAVWMLVFISIERALSVKLPLKVKLIFTVRFARISVIIVWILSFAKAAMNTGQIQIDNKVYGDPGCFTIISQFQILYYIDLFLYTSFAVLIPYPIVLVCTIITISSLLQNKLRKSKSNTAQVKSITVTLVIVNIVYLLSVAPAVVYEIYTLIWIRFNNYLRWTLVDFYNYIVLLNIFAFTSFLHHAFNFLVYFLSGSRFRKETKEMLFFCNWKSNAPEISRKK